MSCSSFRCRSSKSARLSLCVFACCSISVDSDARSTLYRAALQGIMANVPGVLSATVGTPAADVSPDQKTVVALGTLLVTGS